MSVTTIQPTHCDRLAYVYVRQSTPGQVLENRESTERQYHLQARAVAWAGHRAAWKLSTRIRAGRGVRPPTARAFNAWCPKWAWAAWGSC